MNLGELQEELDDLIGRTDYPAGKQQTHLNRAIRRIQSLVRSNDMEKVVTTALDVNMGLTIPSDMRSVRSIFTTAELIPCAKVDINQANQYRQGESVDPVPYYRLTDRYYFPASSPGDEITMVYYASWDALELPGDFNDITVKAPEVVLYGAAAYACTYFKDIRVAEMEQRFMAGIDELERTIWEEEISTGSAQVMQPTSSSEEYPGGY